jgi:hypothetical protein
MPYGMRLSLNHLLCFMLPRAYFIGNKLSCSLGYSGLFYILSNGASYGPGTK